MVNYDAYATTFSNSRKNLKWPELDAIIEDMMRSGYTSVLDIGCGNGRFLEQGTMKNEQGIIIDDNNLLGLVGKKMKTQNRDIIKESKVDENSIMGVRGEGTVGTRMTAIGIDGQSEEKGVGLPLDSFGTFAIKSTGNGVGKVQKENTEHGFLPTQEGQNLGHTGLLHTSQGREQKNQGITYLGLDNSAGMIAEAQNLHPEYQFEVCPMESLGECDILEDRKYDAIIFLASFHHLETREERIQVLEDIQKYLTPRGTIYMTNWNLRDQPRYTKSHQGDGDYDIKIGEFSRYYHGFTLEELDELFHETGYQIVENRIFEGGRNIWSKLQLG